MMGLTEFAGPHAGCTRTDHHLHPRSDPRTRGTEGTQQPAIQQPLGLVDQRSLDVRYAAWRQTENAADFIRALRARNQQLLERGFQHYSIHDLAGVVRWHYHIEHSPDAAGFKVNSVYQSRLARELMEDLPGEFPTSCTCHTPGRPYFETRELRS